MSKNFETDAKRAALGESWTHVASTQLLFENLDEKDEEKRLSEDGSSQEENSPPKQSKVATLIKSCHKVFLGNQSIQFSIGTEGIIQV